MTKQNSVSRDEEFISVEVAAAILGVRRSTLYGAIARGEIKGVKRVGKLIRLRKSALLED